MQTPSPKANSATPAQQIVSSNTSTYAPPKLRHIATVTTGCKIQTQLRMMRKNSSSGNRTTLKKKKNDICELDLLYNTLYIKKERLLRVSTPQLRSFVDKSV